MRGGMWGCRGGGGGGGGDLCHFNFKSSVVAFVYL